MKKCVIIPIYNQKLSDYELISLNQLLLKLKNHSIEIICPERLSNLICKIDDKLEKFNIKAFDNSYFESIQSYSRLLLQPHFYKSFLNYDFILIAQLDSFIFKDEFNKWCSKNYDYIGAPWYNTENSSRFYSKMLTSSNPIISWIKRNVDYNRGKKIFVGNGGLSLRKVKSFYNISKWLQFIEPNIFKYEINEDFVWSILVTKYFKNFKVPTFEEALRFSVEENPKTSLELLEGELPFGCHAWEKHDIEIWKPVFNKFGYKI